MVSKLVAAKLDKSILNIRNQRVLLDSDLAEMYGVETRALVQAVKRNIDRFPEDFMFQLSEHEFLSGSVKNFVYPHKCATGTRRLRHEVRHEYRQV